MDIEKEEMENTMREYGIKQPIKWKKHWGYEGLAYSLLMFLCVFIGIGGAINFFLFDGPPEGAVLLLISPLIIWWGRGGIKTFLHVHHRYYLNFHGSRARGLHVWLDRVLQEGGHRFTKSLVPEYKDPFTTHRPKYVYEIEGFETRVNLVGSFFEVFICVGPFRRDRKDELVSLMALIEGALRRDQQRIIEMASEEDEPREVDLSEALIGLSS